VFAEGRVAATTAAATAADATAPQSENSIVRPKPVPSFSFIPNQSAKRLQTKLLRFHNTFLVFFISLKIRACHN